MSVKGHARSAPGVANANPPAYAEGNSVILSTDLTGRLRTLESAYDTQIGRTQRITPLGSAMVDSPSKEIGGAFTPTLDTVAWTLANSGTGSSATTSNTMAVLTSGTDNNGNATATTNVVARFQYTSSNLLRGTYRLATTDGVGTTRSWGAFNFSTKPAIADGFFFSYDGSSQVLSVNIANAGVTTSVKSGSFNGEVSIYNLDNFVHAYEIVYQNASAFFFIDNVLLHKFKPTTAPFTGTLQLSASALATNSASGTISTTLEVWAANISKMTSTVLTPLFFHIASATTNTIKQGPGMLHRITINTNGNGSVTVYDNNAASGTVIAVISTSATGGIVTLEYGVEFHAGLTVVTTGSEDITVVYD